MPLRFVLDEHLRGPIWTAIRWHNARCGDPIDAVRVGDPPDLPLGIPDRLLLAWAEREGRVLVTLDRSTMVAHLRDHLDAGNHSPGIFLARPSANIPDLVTLLALAAHAGDEDQWGDRVTFIP